MCGFRQNSHSSSGGDVNENKKFRKFQNCRSTGQLWAEGRLCVGESILSNILLF